MTLIFEGKLLDALGVVIIRDASFCRELNWWWPWTANSNVFIPKYGGFCQLNNFSVVSLSVIESISWVMLNFVWKDVLTVYVLFWKGRYVWRWGNNRFSSMCLRYTSSAMYCWQTAIALLLSSIVYCLLFIVEMFLTMWLWCWHHDMHHTIVSAHDIHTS